MPPLLVDIMKNYVLRWLDGFVEIAYGLNIVFSLGFYHPKWYIDYQLWYLNQ